MSGAFNTWFRSTISDLINLMKLDSVGVVILFWQNFVMADKKSHFIPLIFFTYPLDFAEKEGLSVI